MKLLNTDKKARDENSYEKLAWTFGFEFSNQQISFDDKSESKIFEHILSDLEES